MDVDKLRATLLAESDSVIAEQQAKYMRGQFEYVGVKTPLRSQLARPFLASWKTLNHDDLIMVVRQLWAQPERDFRYIGAELLFRHAKGKNPTLSDTDVEFLGELICDQPWWDITDNLDRTIDLIATSEQMVDWAQRESFWLRRVAIIHQLKRKSDTDTALLEQIITLNLGSKEFFINKAIGWALREYSKTDAAWVRAFIANHQGKLALLSVREGSKYL